MERISKMKVFRSRFERLLLIVGLLLLSFYVAARIHGVFSSRAELSRFWQARETIYTAETSGGLRPDEANPDFRLWSTQRIAAYQESLRSAAPLPLAVLSIPSINLEVPVLEGTDEFALNRAVGHIDGTAAPTQNGNIGIAGHRDGFFRALKDIQQGDVIELLTQKRTDRYVVDEVLIVSPEDVAVLNPRAAPSLTLVTCYPFYFVGSAPQRFIVHATISNPVSRDSSIQQESSAGKGGG
jgi:sortase A